MASEPDSWRECLMLVEARLDALKKVGGDGGDVCRGVAEAVAAVSDLRRELEVGRAPLPVGDGVSGPMEVLGHLAAGVAHEINNLLFVIRGSAELARLNLADSDPMQARFRSIDEAVDRAKDLTAMVLYAARNSDDPPPPIRLHPVVKEGAKLIRASLGDGVKIRQDIATDAGAVVVDPLEAHLLVMALLGRAATVLGKERGSLSVTLAETEIDAADRTAPGAAGPCLILTVAFARGQAADNVIDRMTDRKGDRNGMMPPGADIPEKAVEIVRGFGGRIAGHSAGDAAQCFEVVLPLSRPPVMS